MSGWFRRVGWGAIALVLGGVLTWRSIDAHGRNVELYRHVLQAESDLERVRSEGERLKAEKEALETDPQYIEQRLRALRRVESGEVIVDRR